MSRFPVHRDLRWAILVHLWVGFKKWNSAVLFFLRRELNVWISGIQVLGESSDCVFMYLVIVQSTYRYLMAEGVGAVSNVLL